MLTAYVTNSDGKHETFYCLDDGVNVGPSGALILVSSRTEEGYPREMHIYAPGKWNDVNVQWGEDE